MMARIAIAMAALGGLLAAPAVAADSAVAMDNNYFLRLNSWDGNRLLDDAGTLTQAEFWVKSKVDFGDAGTVRFNGWSRGQTRAEESPVDGIARSSRGKIRELYWQLNRDSYLLKVGRQNIIWGRADGLNPTNNLTARDFTLLSAEDADQYVGGKAVRADVTTGLGEFSAIWFPNATSHTLPLAKTTGVSYSIVSPEAQTQWALKWQKSWNNLDGSLSYFDGVDPMPDISVGSIGPQGLVVQLKNNHTRVLGADISLATPGLVWRAEAAQTYTDSTGPSDFSHKKSQFWIVAGVEKTFEHGWTASIQASHLRVPNYSSPADLGSTVAVQVAQQQAATSNQTDSVQNGAIWRISKRARNDALLAEVSGVALLRNGVVRAKVSYALTDDYVAQIGLERYYGDSDTVFGQLAKNSIAYVQLQRSW